MKKLFVFSCLFFFLLVIGIDETDACSCKGRPQGVKGFQTCSAYWYADSVFIGMAEDVTIDRKIGLMKVMFSVEKQFRGEAKEKIEIFTCSDTACCGYPFKQGEKYFVYGRKGQDGKLHEGLCGPTVLLKDAEDDLEYVRELESGKLGTRIFGTVREDRQPTLKDKRSFDPLANIEITIESENNKLRTVTDEKGFYIFKEIPSGIYRVTANFPTGLREINYREDLINHYASVRKDSIRCDSENFIVTKQGSIRGKVVNFDGKKIDNPWSPGPPQPRVSLFPLDENYNILPYSPSLEEWAYRDKFEFFFNVVPAGKYLLAINPNNCPYPNNGMPAMFFPGVADQADSKIITLKEGEQLVLEDFRALPVLKERWFSGVVVYPDGTPAVNATVRLLDANMSNCSNLHSDVKTDESGHFKIKGFETYEYKLNAFSDKKRGQKQFYAQPFIVPKDGTTDNIRLVLDKSF